MQLQQAILLIACVPGKKECFRNHKSSPACVWPPAGPARAPQQLRLSKLTCSRDVGTPALTLAIRLACASTASSAGCVAMKPATGVSSVAPRLAMLRPGSCVPWKGSGLVGQQDLPRKAGESQQCAMCHKAICRVLHSNCRGVMSSKHMLADAAKEIVA